MDFPSRKMKIEEFEGITQTDISEDEKKQEILRKLRDLKINVDDDDDDDDAFKDVGNYAYLKKRKEANEKFEYFRKDTDIYSQWHRSHFEVDGVWYSCAEQFMMHQKAVLFEDCKIARRILHSKHPMNMESLGSKVKGFSADLWNYRSLDVVKTGNLSKFSQNLPLKEQLYSTYPKILVQASPLDAIWGIGLVEDDPRAFDETTWEGKNLLGYILTEVRDELMYKDGIIEDKHKKTMETVEVSGRKEPDAVGGSKIEPHCEPCNREESTYLRAVAYCDGCEEFFCQTCVKTHKRFVSTKYHVLLEGDKMPMTKPAKRNVSEIMLEEECTERCEKHRGKLVKYFCPDHKVVGCTDCIPLGHKSCSRAQLISEISNTEETKQEVESFRLKLHGLTANIRRILQEAMSNKLDIIKQYRVALNSIREYKTELIDVLNDLEKDIEKEAKMLKEVDIKNMDDISVSCKILTKNISDVKTEVETLQKCSNKSKLFTLVQKAKSQIDEWEIQSKEIDMRNKIQMYSFEPEGLIHEMLQKQNILGKLILEKEAAKHPRDVAAKVNVPKKNQKQGSMQCPKCSSGSEQFEIACGHVLCTDCVREQISYERPCSDCGVITGNQPQGSIDTSNYMGNWIKMTFKFMNGIQKEHHPQPGLQYTGMAMLCFLRNNERGKLISKHIQTGFARKLVARIQDGKVDDNLGLFSRDPRELPQDRWNTIS